MVHTSKLEHVNPGYQVVNDHQNASLVYITIISIIYTIITYVPFGMFLVGFYGELFLSLPYSEKMSDGTENCQVLVYG